MAFQTIHTAPNLGTRDRRRAHESGPWAVASRHQPFELMRHAGFVDVDVVDQTEEFRTTQAAWLDEWEQHRDALVALHGECDFVMRQDDRRNQLRATDAGLLRRSLVVGQV
jgi:hypothetical protein